MQSGTHQLGWESVLTLHAPSRNATVATAAPSGTAAVAGVRAAGTADIAAAAPTSILAWLLSPWLELAPRVAG